MSGDGNTFEDVNIAQCTAVLNQVNTGNQQSQQAIQQYSAGDDGDDGAVVVPAEEDQEYAYQYASQDSVQYIGQDAALEQYCAQLVGDVTAEVVADDDAEAAAAAPAAAEAAAAAPAAAEAAAAEELPETGGISLLTLGAGALVISAGLIARRVIR